MPPRIFGTIAATTHGGCGQLSVARSRTSINASKLGFVFRTVKTVASAARERRPAER